MGDADTYLQLRNWRRFQHYRDRRPPWVKLYVELLDDDAMTALPVATQLVAVKFLLLAARTDNLVPYSTRRIAGWLSMRGQDVGPALRRLVEIGYLQVVANAKTASSGDVQLPLTTSPDLHENLSTTSRDLHETFTTDANGAPPQPSEGTAQTSDDTASSSGARARGASTVASTVASSLASAHARPRARGEAEAEAETETELTARQTSTENSARDALPLTSNGRDPVLLGRLIGLGARGDERSAAIIRHEAAGLPEHALARCAESLLGRRPRPANPAGYVVATLRSIRHELGLPATATIDREPPL